MTIAHFARLACEFFRQLCCSLFELFGALVVIEGVTSACDGCFDGKLALGIVVFKCVELGYCVTRQFGSCAGNDVVAGI
jgi:hypothetical protein